MAITNWSEAQPGTNLATVTGTRHKVYLIPEGADIPASVLFGSDAELGRMIANEAEDIESVEVLDRGLGFDPLTNRYGMWIEFIPHGNSLLTAAALIAAVALFLGAATWTVGTVAVIAGWVEKDELPGLPDSNIPGDLARLGVVVGILFLLWIGRPLLQAGADAGAAALGGSE